MILNLGLDSGFGGLEAIYTALADEFFIVKRYRKVSLAIIHLILFVASLPTVTYGGIYVVTFLEFFSTSPALMLVVFFEAISVCWLYGSKKLSNNIYEMYKTIPNIYWIFCWKYAIPSVIFVLFLHSVLYNDVPSVGKYTYPPSFISIGWILNISIMVPIPLFFIKNILNFIHK